MYRLRDYWLRGGGARPDAKGAEWLANQMRAPVPYDDPSKVIAGEPQSTYVNR